MTSDGTLHLLLAILTRAIRDTYDANPLIRAEARQRLADDPLGVEIGEFLGSSLPALHQDHGGNAHGQEPPP